MVEQSRAGLTGGGQGDGRVVTLFFEEEKVQQLLPRGLELAPSDDFPVGKHPVTLLFVTQNNLKLYTGVGPITTVKQYREIILSVNEVQMAGSERRFWYFNKLYLDSIPAIFVGWYFGYPKYLGVLEFNTNSYRAAIFGSDSTIHKQLVSAEFSFKDDYDAEVFQERFEKVKKRLKLPVVAFRLGKPVCSQFHWDFETAAARPMGSEWEITPEMSPAIAGRYIVPGLDEIPASSPDAGGYSLQSSWKLTGTFSCQ